MCSHKRYRQVTVESPAALLRDVSERVFIQRKAMRFCSERLSSLLRTLELADVSDFRYSSAQYEH